MIFFTILLRNLLFRFLNSNSFNEFISDDIIDKICTISDLNISENKFFCYPWSKYANRNTLHSKIPIISKPAKIYKKALNNKEISSQLKTQLSNKISIPIILVGEPGSGKSTFIDFLMNKFSLEKKQSTDGISFYNIENLNFWDCGGEKILLSTHPIILPENCQYIITVNLNHLIHINKEIKNKCKNYTKYWMNEIFHFSTKSDEFQFPPVILLGSHVDCINSNEKLEKATLKLLKMAKLYLKFIFIPHIFIIYDNDSNILNNNLLKIKNQISNNLDNNIRKYLGLDNNNHSNDFYCAFLIYMLIQQIQNLIFENKIIIWWDEFKILLSKTLHVNDNIDKYIKLLSNLGIIKIYQYESENQYKCVFIDFSWISKTFSSIISINNTLQRNNRGFFTQKQIAENLQNSREYYEWELTMRAIELFYFSIRLPSGIYYVPMLLHNLPDKILALDEKNSKNNKNKLILHNFNKNNKKYKFIGRKYEFSPKIPFGLIDKLVIKFLRFSGIKIHPSTYKNDFYLFINENDYNTNSFYHILVQIIENNDFESKNLKISIYYPEEEEIINNLHFSLFCHFIFQSIHEFYDTNNLIKNISIIDENNHEICEEKNLLANFWNFPDFHKYLFSSNIKIFDFDNYYFKFNNYSNFGCFGPVWDGIMFHRDNLQYGIDFICKELIDFTYNDYKTLINEIILLKSIKNQFIIEILGISKANTNLLEEKSKKNQIFDNEKYLQNQILIILEKPGNLYGDNYFSTKLKIKIAFDIVKAVYSLYSNAGVKIIQHEINSNNIFIFSNDENLISDFHFVHAKLGCFNNQFAFDKTCYSKFYKDFRYSPPEICIGSIDICNYQEIDVYSFGILFWEILTNEISFAKDDFESYKIKLENDERPPIDKLPNDVPYDIIQLIQACWNPKPNLRPNFDTIIWIIETVLIQITSKSCVSQTNPLCRALYTFPGDNVDELPFLKNEIIEIIIKDDLWCQGSIEGKQGYIPRNYIQLLSSFDSQTKFCRVIHWFDAIGKDELSFRENDIIQIHGKKTNSEGWMLGSLHGKKGYFPSNYTENIPFYKFIGTDCKNIYKVICSFVPTRSGELLLHEDDIIDVLEDEGDWWKGSLYSKQGYFPSSCVQKIKYFPGLGFKPGSTRDKRVQIRKRNNFSCRALYSFKGENPDELTFKENDIIRVLDESTELGGGWWKGLFNGKIGFFPASYVKKIRYYPGIRTSRRRP